MTDYVKRAPLVCATCGVTPMDSDGVFTCNCQGKEWKNLEYPRAIRVDAETETLLAQKGFNLVPAANYYFGFGDMITVYSNGDWRLESLTQGQPSIENLKDYLAILPDSPSR
jgi:hypothetical protein